MPASDKRKKGLAKFEEVMQFAPPPFESDPFLDCTVDHLFADVWGAPGLSVRERRLVTLTTLISLGHEMHLRMHLQAAMNSGDLDDAAIDALIVHAAHYSGWPGAAAAAQVVRQLRAQRDKEKPDG